MDELMTITEVAEYLRVPVPTVRKWRYEGTGPPAMRVGKHLRFDRRALLAWVDGLRESPTTAA